MMNYIKRNWSHVVYLHEEMLSEMVFNKFVNGSINYFFSCNNVYRKEINLKGRNRKVGNRNELINDVESIDLKEAIESLCGDFREVAEMLSLGYTERNVMVKLNITPGKLKQIKKGLRNDRKFINKIKSN